MSFRTVVGFVGVAALAVVGCGGDDEQPVGGAAPLPERPTGQAATERFDLEWETPDGGSWPMTVIAPVDDVEGGWPVLVTFHGAAAGTSASEMSAVAHSGVVVVGPRWILPEWSYSNLDALDPNDYVEGDFFDVAWCALGAAQQAARDHGGNPDRTTVEGFSAGVHPAGWVALGLVRDDPCPEVEVVAPVGVVIGDAQWLFEGTGGEWDATFLDGSSQAADTVDRYLDPDRWTVPDGFRAYLWSSRSTAVDRSVEHPPAADSWLRTRGGDDLVDDLASFGAFDDGAIGFVDNGLLMELRMERAGLDVVHEEIDVGHTRNPQMMERTIELVWQQPFEDG